MMLGLMEEDEPVRTKAIRERAVRYYEPQQGPAARAEEIYHRIGLEQPAGEIDARWLPGVQSSLSRALSELSGARKAFLASRLGVEVAPEDAGAAELADWERLTERRVQELVGSGGLTEALGELRQRTERTGRSPLFELEAIVHSGLGDLESALKALEQGRRKALEGGNRELLRHLAVKAFDLLVRARRFSDAHEHLATLQQIARPDHRLDRLELASMRALLHGLEEGFTEGDEVAAAFDDIRDQDLATRPELISRAGAVLGPRHSAQLVRVLQLAGVPEGRNETVRRDLAVHLARFDADYSADSGESPGVIARSIGLSETPTLTETWSTALLRLDRYSVGTFLLQVSKQYPVPEAVWDSLATLYRFDVGWQPEEQPRWGAAEGHSGVRRYITNLRVHTDLVGGLVSGFGRVDALQDFLVFRLDRSSRSLSGAQELAALAEAVVRAAESEGWIVELAWRALEARPEEPRLTRVASRLGISTLATANAPYFQRPDRIIKLSLLETHTVRVEVGDQRAATGILIGVDTVLTAAAALMPVSEARVRPSDVTVRFDCRSMGGQLTPGTPFGLQREWIWGDPKANSRYILLRVLGSPGAQPVGGSKAEPSARPRGWVDIVGQDAPDAASGLAVVHHYRGRALELSQCKSVTPTNEADGLLSTPRRSFQAHREDRV